jgi:hypothetical protein
MSRMSNLPYVKGYTVTLTAGTPVQGTDYDVPAGVEVLLKAGNDNTGIVTMASTSATAINSSTDNFPLLAGQAVTVQVQNTKQLYFDSTVTGDTVRVFFEYETIV